MSFELALEEKEDTDTRNMLEQVDYMLLGLMAKDDSDVEEAIKYFSEVINAATDEKSVLAPMQEEAKQSKIELQELQQLQEEINEYEESISKAADMLKEKGYSESKNILNKVIENTKDHADFQAQHKRAQEILKQVHTEVARLEAQRLEEKALLAAQEAIKNPVDPTINIEQVARGKGYHIENYKLADLNKDGVKDYVAIVTKVSDSYRMVIDGAIGEILATDEIYLGENGNSLDIYNIQGEYHILERQSGMYPSYAIYHWNNGQLIHNMGALYHGFDITLGGPDVLQVRYPSGKNNQNFSIPHEAYMELAVYGELDWYSITQATIKDGILLHSHFIILSSPHNYEPLIMTEKSSWNGSKWVLDKVEYTTPEYGFLSGSGQFKKIK